MFSSRSRTCCCLVLKVEHAAVQFSKQNMLLLCSRSRTCCCLVLKVEHAAALFSKQNMLLFSSQGRTCCCLVIDVEHAIVQSSKQNMCYCLEPKLIRTIDAFMEYSLYFDPIGVQSVCRGSGCLNCLVCVQWQSLSELFSLCVGVVAV